MNQQTVERKEGLAFVGPSFFQKPRPSAAAESGMPGRRFGRWTVLDFFITTPRGEKKWRCRCDCGTERYVLERSLKYGGSKSCGCLQRERSRETAYDLTGRTFGDLTALYPAARQRRNGGVWWTCRCSCGRLYDCPASLLVQGKRTHCGCKTNRGRPADITGQRFHRLTAEYMLPERDADGSVIWRCRCDCGNEINVSYNNLVYSGMKSCGCRKKEHDQELGTLLTHVGGTSLEMIQSQKLPRDNTTGYKGVYLVRGKYLAKIVFQKKQYFLGTYDSIEEAAAARKSAEALLFGETAAFIQKWKESAAKNPEWAGNNPVEIQVSRDRDGRLAVSYSPQIL